MYPAFECGRSGPLALMWSADRSQPNGRALRRRVAELGFSDRRSRPFRIDVL